MRPLCCNFPFKSIRWIYVSSNEITKSSHLRRTYLRIFNIKGAMKQSASPLVESHLMNLKHWYFRINYFTIGMKTKCEHNRKMNKRIHHRAQIIIVACKRIQVINWLNLLVCQLSTICQRLQSQTSEHKDRAICKWICCSRGFKTIMTTTGSEKFLSFWLTLIEYALVDF